MAHLYDPQWQSVDAALPWLKTQLSMFGINLEMPTDISKLEPKKGRR
jgi:hypothetical protein